MISFQDQFLAQCSWLSVLQDADDNIAIEMLNAMVPSSRLLNIVELTFLNLKKKIKKKIGDVELSEGVCMHHRDGPDWHNHCKMWQGNNCENFEDKRIEDLVKDRIPASYRKKWMYYVGDAPPSTELTDAIKEHSGLELFHRTKDNLLNENSLKNLINRSLLSNENHRDIFAAIDFFVCQRIPSFIGNSVSTFSSLQIALRRGKKSTWYNSRSNPLLADFLKVQKIPIVYTYTEESQVMGKILLKASITSVRLTFGTGIDINVMYHGANDKLFLEWLAKQNVIIHKHEPQWIHMIDSM